MAGFWGWSRVSLPKSTKDAETEEVDKIKSWAGVLRPKKLEMVSLHYEGQETQRPVVNQSLGQQYGSQKASLPRFTVVYFFINQPRNRLWVDWPCKKDQQHVCPTMFYLQPPGQSLTVCWRRAQAHWFSVGSWRPPAAWRMPLFLTLPLTSHRAAKSAPQHVPGAW